ncbi:MAG TPA: hypothetical protein VMN39_07875, partial [Longimicrobiaceae bacterium]|nr:hypothetical protein [Longimicrobiaceae bacterium]
ERLHRRARHVVTEERRTVAAAEALSAGRWDALGPLMRDSHRSLRDDYEVSCPELDLLVEIADTFEGGGVIGARMTGGGFGGSTVTLVRRGACKELVEALTSRYRSETGREATIILTRPAAGAHPLPVPAVAGSPETT